MVRTSRDELRHSDAAFERAAAIFRAVGDVARLKLLARLASGEWCVSELAEAADVGLSTVSQQLRLLRAEKLVARRREGKHIHYRLADDHVLALVQSALSHASEDLGPGRGHAHDHARDSAHDLGATGDHAAGPST